MVDTQPGSYVPESVIRASEQVAQEEAQKVKYSPEQMALWWNKLLEKFFPISTQHIELNLQNLQDFYLVANNNKFLEGPFKQRKDGEQRRQKMVDALREFFTGEYDQQGKLVQKVVVEVDAPSFVKREKSDQELLYSTLSTEHKALSMDFMEQTFAAYPDLQEYVESKSHVKFDQETSEMVDSYFFHDIGNILMLIAGYVELLIEEYKSSIEKAYEGLKGVPGFPKMGERITPQKEAELAEYLSFEDFLASTKGLDLYFKSINSNLRQLHFMLEQFDLEEGKISREPDRIDLVLGQFGKLLAKEAEATMKTGQPSEPEVLVNFPPKQVWDVEDQLKEEYEKHVYSRFNRTAVIRTVKNIISNFRKASKDLIKERKKFAEKHSLYSGQDMPRPELPEEVFIKNKRIAVERLLSSENDYRLDVTLVKNGEYLEFYFDDYNLGYPPDEKMTLVESHNFSRKTEGVNLYRYVPERNKTAWISEHGTGRGMVGLQKDLSDLLEGEMMMVNRARNGFIEGATIMIRVRIGTEESFTDQE